MAFTCYKCLKRQLSSVAPDAELVAQDAQEENRHALAAKIRMENVVVDPALARVVELHPIGENGPWEDLAEGELVFLPSIGVSVGPCESCGRHRPCVNT